MDDLLKWRAEFPILERSTYLISNSLGAMPRGVYDRLHDYAESWATRGVRAWEETWWTMAAILGDLVAPLLGVAAGGSVVFQPNVTMAHAVVLIGCGSGGEDELTTRRGPGGEAVTKMCQTA